MRIAQYATLKGNMAAGLESQLRNYDFPTDQLPRLSCKDRTVYELLKAGVSNREMQYLLPYVNDIGAHLST